MAAAEVEDEASLAPNVSAGEDNAQALLESASCIPLYTSKCTVLHYNSQVSQLLSLNSSGECTASQASGSKLTKLWTTQLVDAGTDTVTTAALSSDGRLLAVGLDSVAHSKVQVWLLEEDAKIASGVRPKMVARYSLPVSCMHWHSSKHMVAIGSESGYVNLWELEEGSLDKTHGSLRGSLREPCKRDSGIRGVALASHGNNLAVADCNGNLTLFNDSDEQTHQTQVWRRSSQADSLQMSWNPEGSVLALPVERQLKLLSTTTASGIETTVREMDSVHSDTATRVAWSADGDLLATASRDCVAVWTCPNGIPETVTRRFALDAMPHSLLWRGMLIALGTSVGSVALLSLATQEAKEEGAEKTAQEPEPLAEEADDTSAIPCSPHSQTIKDETSATQAGQTSAPQPTRIQQELVHPCASREAGRRRYLAWNEHGTLKVFPAQDLGKHATSQSRKVKAALGADPSSRVEVEYSKPVFAPLATGAGRDFPAPPGLQLGALGPGSCALVAPPLAGQLAKVVVHVAAPWCNSSFDHILPFGEEVQAVALGSEFLAVVTAPHRFLRIHALSGMQLGVLALPGDVVCLVAGGDLILCITRADPCLQSLELEYTLYGVACKERLANGRLPLTPESGLRWAGFTADAMPLCLDTSGALRALALAGTVEHFAGVGAAEWVPIAQLEKGGSAVWPVYAEGAALLCAPLEKPGADPKVGSTLRLQRVPFHLPVDAERPALEQVFRHNLLHRQRHFATEAQMLPTPQRRNADNSTADNRKRKVPSAFDERIRAKAEKKQQERAQSLAEEEKTARRLCLQSLSKLCGDQLSAGDPQQAYDIARLLFSVYGSSRSDVLQLLTSVRHAATLHKYDDLWSLFRQLHDDYASRHPEAARVSKSPADTPTQDDTAETQEAASQLMLAAGPPTQSAAAEAEVAQPAVDALEEQRKRIAANRALALERKRQAQSKSLISQT
mmetsp:Transcript_9186/g.21256  ORF Transcript_9186/g.21256 Transcript_9186/m.21256 type:complete len:960 (+) Transcript_9186:56-2935(+)